MYTSPYHLTIKTTYSSHQQHPQEVSFIVREV